MKVILLAEDDPGVRKGIARTLSAAYVIEEAADGPTAMAKFAENAYDLLITDLRLPGADGMEVLKAARAAHPGMPVMMITGNATIANAVQAIREGADDYIEKPFTFSELRLRVERVIDNARLKQELAYLRHEQPHIYNFEGIIGSSGALKDVFELVSKVARSDATVLVTGETGTGKELIAAAIHHNSRRSTRAMVKVNCAALHDNLLESELFGHERGAFTGADAQRVGRFEQADGGTLFLDEIGDMSAGTQSKVLRAIQEGEFERLGGTRTLRVNVRFMAATHRDLHGMVDQGTFRADLYYRLNVVTISIPPLRERREDVPALADAFRKQVNRETQKEIEGFEPQALKILRRHNWPGNIRELRNVVERAVLMCDGPMITQEHLELGEAFASVDPDRAQLVRLPPRGVPLADIERQTVLQALKLASGVQRDAAELLSISPRVFNYKMKTLGIERPRDRDSSDKDKQGLE